MARAPTRPHALQDVATVYNTIDFFTNRSVIDAAMQTALAERLYTAMRINVTEFNLLAIDVPDAFERAVLDKVITAQDVITLTNLRQSQVIRTEIAVVQQTAQAQVALINAAAAADGLRITKQAEADAFTSLMEARGTWRSVFFFHCAVRSR
jgi:regulator of protease activity HflC (stomatin/prohibitin superfamily)